VYVYVYVYVYVREGWTNMFTTLMRNSTKYIWDSHRRKQSQMCMELCVRVGKPHHCAEEGKGKSKCGRYGQLDTHNSHVFTPFLVLLVALFVCLPPFLRRLFFSSLFQICCKE
jgi:hypothetical protein